MPSVVIHVIVFVFDCGFVVGAYIWQSMKGKITTEGLGKNGAVLVEVTVCDADLVKFCIYSLRSGNTSKKKCLRHLFHLNVVVKIMCLT